jgi:hypothetical protein
LVGPPVQSCSVCCFFFFLPTAAALLLLLDILLLLLLSLDVTREEAAASVEPAVLVVRFDRAILSLSLIAAFICWMNRCRLVSAFRWVRCMLCRWLQTVSCRRWTWKSIGTTLYVISMLHQWPPINLSTNLLAS